jgi:hypothetical protein
MLRNLMTEFGSPPSGPTIIAEDNRACYYLSTGQSVGSKLKHIEIRHHKLRELQRDGVIRVVATASADMLADLMTNPLPIERFIMLRDLILGYR